MAGYTRYRANGHEGWLDTLGIELMVMKKVDQGTLPLEERMPDCLEGIPVHVIEMDPPEFLTRDLISQDFRWR